MFVLAEIKDYIRIPPHNFHKPLKQAISEELNKKLANKVVMNVGLCIALWDITDLGNSHIIPGDGCCHTKVNFRYVVFRPFMTEILTGKVKSCNREGVNVTLGFFDDILIPSSSLQHPSRFDEVEQVWVWEYQVDDEKHDLFMDIGEIIRFRVTTEIFEETSPSGPDIGTEVDTIESKVPYSLIASINEPGLGLMSWLKFLNVVRSYTLKIDFGRIEEDLKDCLIEFNGLLRRCVKKIHSKPRRAEIRNVIGVLVRKKNIKRLKDTQAKCKAITGTKQGDKPSYRLESNERYLCEFCGNKFFKYSTLKDHILKIHESAILKCKESHFTVENEAENACKRLSENVSDICHSSQENPTEKVFPQQEDSSRVFDLKHDRDRIAGNDGAEILHCPQSECQRIFHNRSSMKKHIRLKHGTKVEYQCSNCEKVFFERGKLNRHILSHQGGKFQCLKCHRTFHRADNLRRHIASHVASVKAFACRFCKKTFSLKFNRNTHEANVHASTDIQCEFCGKKCKNESTLKVHQRLHEINRISCGLCTKTFTRKAQYRNHLKNKHKGLSPFQKFFDSFATSDGVVDVKVSSNERT